MNDDAAGSASDGDARSNVFKPIAQKNYVCTCLRRPRAVAHCYGYIGAGQNRRVIDSVAGHRDDLSALLHFPYGRQFLFGT